jgi:hypothetical protein
MFVAWEEDLTGVLLAIVSIWVSPYAPLKTAQSRCQMNFGIDEDNPRAVGVNLVLGNVQKPLKQNVRVPKSDMVVPISLWSSRRSSSS